MNFLVVTHSYAPDQTPRAFRWSAITEHWAAHDAHVDVVTSGRNAPDGDDRIGMVGIHRVGERAMGRMRLGLGEGAVAGRLKRIQRKHIPRRTTGTRKRRAGRGL